MQPVSSIAAIVTQHAEDAAFLWLRRRNEIDGPLLDETDIGRIDLRLDANLEGLEASGPAAWKIAKSLLEDYSGPGEMFIVGVLALRSGDPMLLGEAFEFAATLGAPAFSALSGAVARVDRDALRPHVADWLHSRSPGQRGLGLAALWHHRVDPGARLPELLDDVDELVRIRAIRLAGRLKLRAHAPEIAAALARDGAVERLAAATTLCLLGDTRAAWPVLDRLVQTGSDVARQAMETRLLVTPAGEAKRWLQSRLEQPITRDHATALIGLLGDKSVTPWLIGKMRDPERIVAAAEALRDLFEVNFDETGCFTSDGDALGKEFAALDDPALPVADRVEAWWDQGRGGKAYSDFRSMRWHRLQALRKAFAEPDILPANWRRTRSHPAWM